MCRINFLLPSHSVDIVSSLIKMHGIAWFIIKIAWAIPVSPEQIEEARKWNWPVFLPRGMA